MVILYHLCDKEASEDIISNGFINGEDGFVWFAKHPKDIWGESSRSRLLSIIVSMSDQKIESFAEIIEDEEEYNNKTGEWVPSLTRELNCNYYAIPAFVINNSIVDITIVSEAERKELLQ